MDRFNRLVMMGTVIAVLGFAGFSFDLFQLTALGVKDPRVAISFSIFAVFLVLIVVNDHLLIPRILHGIIALSILGIAAITIYAHVSASSLRFSQSGLWYSYVREGTSEHLALQASCSCRVGVWVHILFPTGDRDNFYRATNSEGRWSQSFSVPSRSARNNSGLAVVTVQLWRGKQTTRTFLEFHVIR
jgi:hypothetical protein